MTELACESEFIRAFLIGLMLGGAVGFLACAVLILSRLADSDQ